MRRTEIDDIFAGKSTTVSVPVSSSSKAVLKGKASTSSDSTAKKRKKKKKEKAAPVPKQEEILSDPVQDKAPVTTKRKAETVLDPSTALPTTAKRFKTGKDGTGKPKKNNADDLDEGRFRDSRGTGPRRRTDEGYAVYKEDELGIQDGGGDTPLCPFDCDCCF